MNSTVYVIVWSNSFVLSRSLAFSFWMPVRASLHPMEHPQRRKDNISSELYLSMFHTLGWGHKRGRDFVRIIELLHNIGVPSRSRRKNSMLRNVTRSLGLGRIGYSGWLL
jgi:hypothetical protein